MSDGASGYLQHLPLVLRRAAATGETPFLGDYLKIFEALLSGRSDAAATSIDETIEGFEQHLDAGLTPAAERAPELPIDSEFLTYLASWVALALDQNWDLEKKRLWVRRIVSLYKKRGTRAGLMEYLNVFVGDAAVMEEPPGGFEIAGTSTIAVDAFIAGGPAYFFRVIVNYGAEAGTFDLQGWKNIQDGTRAIVDLEKPAHTYYELQARTPGLVVARRATVGSDTLLWRRSLRV